MGLEDALLRLSQTNSPHEDDIRLVSSSLVRISAELAHEEAVIKMVSSELATAKAEVAKLQYILAAVVRKRDKLKETLGTSRRLVSDAFTPARRIPMEILQQIFRVGLDPFPVIHGSSAPLLFGQVCRYWREVAYATPELWTSVHIVVPTTGMAQYSEDALLLRGRSLLDFTIAWLDRAGERPLQISIFSKPFPGSTLMDFLTDFIIRLSMYFKQCTYLRIAVPFECLNFLPALGVDAVAALETVTLTDSRMPVVFNSPVLHPDALPLLTSGPRLRKLSLSSTPDMEFRPVADWGSLHSLALHVNSDETFGPSEALNILLECSRLQSFTLDVSCPTWRWTDTTVWTTALTLPYLTTLSIKSFFSTFLNSIFSHIVIPSIRRLVVGIGRYIDEEEACNLLNGLRQLLQPSSEIEVLKVTSKRSPDHMMGPRLSQSIRGVLGAVPSVSHLTLDLGSKMIHEEFLLALRVNCPLPRHGALCPNLSEVALPDTNDSIGKPADSVLEDFVLSRFNPHEPVAHLRRFISSLQPSVSCIKALKDSGCSLAMNVPPPLSNSITSASHLNSPFASVPDFVEIGVASQEADLRLHVITHGQ
ncbi:hypothetical protein L218DRAFT_1075311 [Marasmius fiardii PR-910]|nr:hypothetical protein L218DRAFT_1075311 [Marasmius fiardii PR-910]